MQQYRDIKQQYNDCILFFRMGDFYEIFWEDAKICAKVLDIVLTSRNKDSDNAIPMAGIPYHSVDKYITKLVHHGYKIAIAEQTTTPSPGKIVERQVQSVITPGTYLQEKNKNFAYIMAVYYTQLADWLSYHIAWGDFSLGQYYTRSFGDMDTLLSFVLSVNPVELIMDPDFPYMEDLKVRVQNYTKCLVSVYDIPYDADKYVRTLCRVQTLASYGKALEIGRLQAFALLLHYISYTQKKQELHIVRVALHSQDQMVLLDDITIKNLEILASSYEGQEKFGLLGIVDRTQTTAGARHLRWLLTHPIYDLSEISKRQWYISYALDNIEHTESVHQVLHQVSDIIRLVSIVLYKKCTPQLLVKLRTTLKVFFGGQQSMILLKYMQYYWLTDDVLDTVRHLYNHLDQLLKDDEDISYDLDFVRDGYNEELDKLKNMAFRSDEALLDYQQELVQETSIAGIKVSFIRNQGYFIEITNKDIDKFEAKGSRKNDKYDFMRRQTLKGCQRYVTPYLDTIQQAILDAKDKLWRQENILLLKTQEKMGSMYRALTIFAEHVAMLDVYTSHALLVRDKQWSKPVFVREHCVQVLGGRHPVIEQYLPVDQQFIPNNLELTDKSYVHIITGPNMGGKSTYLRQNAIIVLLAHCGLWVPAKELKLSPVDALFARVGSGDIIAKNQSTFMTEMIEVANIINNATQQSFVIFDELGRGTSTYDGLAITQSILHHIVSTIKCQTLIATHYHELIEMAKLPWVDNFSVSVYETDKEVVFMKKIVKGGASKSYGIDVAQLAGIPGHIVEQAKHILQHLEQEHEAKPAVDFGLLQASAPVESQEGAKYAKVKNILASYDLNQITPLQALQLLAKIKEEL